MLYYVISNNLYFCTAWQNGETRKSHFHSNAVLVKSAAAVGLCCTHSAPVRCVPERKIVICDVFGSVYICWDTPLILSVGFHSGLTKNNTQLTLLLITKLHNHSITNHHSICCWCFCIVCYFVSFIVLPVVLFGLMTTKLNKLYYIFYTATDTMTYLFNIEHAGNRQQDSRSCLVHPVDRFDSEGWFSCKQVIF